MAYVTGNPPTKKALTEALTSGKRPLVYQPGGMWPLEVSTRNGVRTVTVEGPHAPKPHRWYATVEVDDANRAVRVLP